jgi:hypothetical protein
MPYTQHTMHGTLTRHHSIMTTYILSTQFPVPRCLCNDIAAFAGKFGHEADKTSALLARRSATSDRIYKRRITAKTC